MSDYEPDEDLYVEVENLREPGSSGMRSAPRPPLFSAGAPRHHVTRLLIAFGCLALVVALVFASVPSARDSASGLLRTFVPAPATPAPAYASRFYLQPNPPGVAVTLDGHPLDSPPLPGDPHPLVLAPGRHTFTWTSSWFPFRPLRCVVSAPSGSQRPPDSCPLDLLAPPDIVGQPQPHGYVISLRLSLASLPTAQAQALLAAIHGALATPFTTTVQPGEQYTLDTSASTPRAATASDPLRATLSYSSPPDSFYAEPCQSGGIVPCRFPGQDCALICSIPPALAAQVGSSAAWIAGIGVHAAWTYATQSGKLVVANVVDRLGTLVMLRITWDGARWQVTPLLGHTAALPAADDAACDNPVSQLAGTASWSFIVTGPPPGAQVAVVSGPSPADGCVLVVLGKGAPAPLFLGRFGLLFTANDSAVNPTDNLPVASPAEQAFAQQLAAVYLHPS